MNLIHLTNRAVFLEPLLLMTGSLFILIPLFGRVHVALYFILLFLCGFTIGGPYHLMPGAIASDLVSSLNLCLYIFLSY